MKIQEGPAFGALIIGSGIAFLFYQKTQKLGLAIGVGAVVGLIDYGVLAWVATLKKRHK